MNPLYYTAAAFILGTAVYKSRDLLRTPQPPSLRAVCVTLYALGIAFLLLANASRPVVDRLVGVVDFTRWIGNSCTLTSACAIQIVLAYFTRRDGTPPPRLRLRIGVLAVGIAAMGILILSDRHNAPDVPDFIDAYGNRVSIAGYLLIYLAYLGVAMADALQLSWRYAPHAHRSTCASDCAPWPLAQRPGCCTSPTSRSSSCYA